ncbi:TauD/TfdA dioxygenase family protein [Pseudonocardia endophytica]|nr:TauD/TfdA family dioxygenase [Pseudonocardia endophytica]
MECTAHEPIGVTVTGVSVAGAGAGLAPPLRDLLAEHGVAVLPDQWIDDDAFLTFLRGFGELAFTAGETPLPGHDDLNVISNVGRTTPPRSVFHVDTSYVRRPPAYTALRAVSIPEAGGETLFTNQYRAYETLPEALRDKLAGRTIRHVVSGVDPGEGQETEAEHPVFRRHPISGRVALYLSTPARCVAVSGMDEQESADTIARLYEHATHERNVYRHRWAPGDVVIWDNACVLHRADHDGVVGDRVMHRGMVAGTDVPSAVA